MRTISGAALGVLAGPVVPMALLLEIQFSPVVRLASSAVTIEHGGQLYHGAGSLGSVEPVRDAPGQPAALRFTLSGVPSENVALALQDSARGAACTLMLAVLDPATHAVLDVPTTWVGQVDQMPISLGSETAAISVVATHLGARLRRAKPLRYTEGDQQRLVPGDTSLRFTVAQAQRQDVWPAAAFFRQ